MVELTWHDLGRALRLAPKSVLELLKRHPMEVFVAGGFIRAAVSGEEINDIDLFVASKESAKQYAGELLSEHPDWRLIPTDNAITVLGYRYPIQIIHRWVFSHPINALNSFDFTISRAAFWADPILVQHEGLPLWKSTCDNRFYPDLAAKRLIYTSPVREEEAGGSMLRILKFYQRGYRIPLDSFGSVISRLIAGIDFNNLPMRPEGHRKPPYTHDEAVAKAVAGLLREVDPEIGPNHVAHLPAEED